MSEYTIEKFSSTVPLRYDTIYYVECPGNDKLNHAMYQIQQDGPLFFDIDMPLFSIKLQYISQEELGNEHLRAQLGDYDANDVDDAIYYLRDCLSADNGGALTARYMPRKGSADTQWDVCSLSLIGITSPSEIYERAKNFARDVVETDFARLSGVPYDTYLKARDEEYNSYRATIITKSTRHSSDSSRIIQKTHKSLVEICGNLKNEDDLKDFAQMLKSVIKMTKKIGKLNVFCPIVVDENRIFIKISEEKLKEVAFRRAGIAKTLYIFFLRQIEKAYKNHSEQPKYISKAGLADYKEELISIYKKISRWAVRENIDIENIIESLYDTTKSSYNEFDNSLSAIRDAFKHEFDLDAIKEQEKCYTIEIMGKDKKYNTSVYGINLDPGDFKLGKYSIEKL